MGVFVTVIIGVFFRYVLNNALVWSEEMSRFCMLWMAFLGTPLVTYKGGHVAIEVILGRTRGFLRTAFIIFIQFIIFFVLILLAWVGTILSIRSIPQHSTAVPWLSYIYFYLPMPIGALLMLPTSLEIFIKQQFIEKDR